MSIVTYGISTASKFWNSKEVSEQKALLRNIASTATMNSAHKKMRIYIIGQCFQVHHGFHYQDCQLLQTLYQKTRTTCISEGM